MKKALLVVAPLMFALMMTSSSMMVAGCGGGGSGGSGGGSGGGTMDGGTDFTCDTSPNAETAQTVFTKVATMGGANSCQSCHTPPNGLGSSYGDYSTADKMYAAMVNHGSVYSPTSGDVLQMVKPNDLAHSTVWIKLVCAPTSTTCNSPGGTHVGAPMPYQTGMQLPADQLKAVKDWICTGAKQN